jgi:hypothetical protein
MAWTAEDRRKYAPAIQEVLRQGMLVRLAATIDTIDPPCKTGRPRDWSTVTMLGYPVRKAGQSMVCADARAFPWHVGVVRWSAWRHRFPTWTLDRSMS